MNISKRSWHYRLYNFWRNVIDFDRDGPLYLFPWWRDHETRYYNPPSNLCKYFWTTLILTGFTWILVLGAGIVLGLIGLLYFAFVWPIERYKDSNWRHARLDAKYRAKLSEGASWKPPTPKEPGILVAFLKAKKAKACPLITLVD